MRDYVLVAFVLASIPMGLLRPYYALLIYAWVSYMYPHMYTWSFGRSFPSAKLMAVTAIVGALGNRDIDVAPLRKPAMITMLGLLAWFTMSSLLAYYPDRAWLRWQEVSKVIVMALFSSMLLTTQKRMRLFLIVVAFSLGFYGVKGGLFSLLTGGEQMVGGAGTSIIAANNSAGLALNMALPLMWYLAAGERGWIKRLLQAGFFLSIPAVMFTYSRASAITLAAVLIFLLLKGRHIFLLIAVLLIGAVVAVPYIPEKWWNRQLTTLEYDEDSSAMSRIDIWKVCWRLTLDHPVTGLGFEFMSSEMFSKYAPEYLEVHGKAFNTHSIYFAVLASHGFPGFVLFMGMIALTFTSCWRIRRSVRGWPDLKWCATYCNIVTVSLLAFLINGAFVNMEYYDLPYHLVAVTASLAVISKRALTSESREVVESVGNLTTVPAV